MSDYVTKSEFVEKVRTARNKWDAAVACIPPADGQSPDSCGDWSLKDVIAHITWYDQEMVTMLERREFAGSDLWELPTDQRNAAIHERVKDGTLTEKIVEARQVFECLMELIASLNDKDLSDPTSFPGLPLDWKPWQVLASNTYEHYEEHVTQAEAFLKQSTDTPSRVV